MVACRDFLTSFYWKNCKLQLQIRPARLLLNSSEWACHSLIGYLSFATNDAPFCVVSQNVIINDENFSMSSTVKSELYA